MTFEEKQKIIFTYAYVQSAIDFIEGALAPLKEQLKVLDDLIMEKAAPTTPIVETAAKENISTSLSDKSEDLSSYHVGQNVYVGNEKGKIIDICNIFSDPISIRFSTGMVASYSESDIIPF